VTYAQLRDQSRALAVRLQNVFNLKYGDTIAVCLPNSIEFPIVCLGGLEASLTITTVNPIYTPRKCPRVTCCFPPHLLNLFSPPSIDEISRQLLDSGAKVIFGITMMSPILEKSVAMTGRPIKIIYVKEAPSSAIPTNGIDFGELVETKGE
jgi:4-coumarate--CoA ligase